MSEHSEVLAKLAERVVAAESFLDVEGKRTLAAELEEQASAPDLWDDPAKGQDVTSRLARLRGEVRFTFEQKPLVITTTGASGGE